MIVVVKTCDCCGKDVELPDDDDRDEILCKECGERIVDILGDYVENEKVESVKIADLAERMEFALTWSRVGYHPQGEITDQQKADVLWIKTRYSELYAKDKGNPKIYWEATRISRIEFLEKLLLEQDKVVESDAKKT